MELYGSFALRPGDEVAFAGAMLMCMGIGMVLSVACYVLEALSLYTIAQRRGIRKPWLAWIPVVNVWIVGSISDQYQYVVNRRIQNRRKVLLGLAIALMGSLIALCRLYRKLSDSISVTEGCQISSRGRNMTVLYTRHSIDPAVQLRQLHAPA